MAMAALVTATGFTSCSSDDLDTNQYNKSGVNILAFGPMPITRGETMRLTGTKLDNVREVLFPEGNQKLTPSTTYIKGDFSLKNSEEMLVTIPDLCVPGKLRLVTANGDTIVSRTNITFEEEIKVNSFSPEKIHPGAVLTIKGDYVWNIGQVVFYDHVAVDAEDFVKNTRNEIQVIVPMEAKPGELSFNDGSEGAENKYIGMLDVDVAEATGVSNATPDFGETITIYGENLDLVTSMDFPAVPDVSYNIANDGKSIRVEVPRNTISGTVTMKSASGLTTSVDITVPLASVAGMSPTKDVKVGMTITITGENLNRITEVMLPGVTLKQGEFSQSTGQITFVVPEGMFDGVVTLIQHDNWSVDAGRIMMYSEAAEEPIWVGQFVCSSWNGNQDLAWGGFDWTTIPANTKLNFYYKKNNPGVWGAISLRHGNEWGNLPAPIPGQYDLGEDEGVLSVVLPQNVLDDIIANNGMVITGDNFTLTKITVPSAEKTLWSGEQDLGSWSVNFEMTPNTMFVDAGAKLGQEVRIYGKKTSDWWQVQLFDGHWGKLHVPGWSGDDSNNINAGMDTGFDENGYFSFRLNDEILNHFLNDIDWGYAFIVQGENFIMTKVTITD